jgi:hypothetical protein
MTMTDGVHNGFGARVVNFVGVYFVAQIFLCNFASLFDGFLTSIACNESINDRIGYRDSFVLFPGILRELSGGIFFPSQ